MLHQEISTLPQLRQKQWPRSNSTAHALPIPKLNTHVVAVMLMRGCRQLPCPPAELRCTCLMYGQSCRPLVR